MRESVRGALDAHDLELSVYSRPGARSDADAGVTISFKGSGSGSGSDAASDKKPAAPGGGTRCVLLCA